MTVLAKGTRSGVRASSAARRTSQGPHLFAKQAPPRDLHWSAAAVALAGLLYNPVLAIVNGHAFGISVATVILTEGLVLLAAAILIMRSGRRPGDALPAIVFGFFLLDAILVSILSGVVVLDMARSGAIIALFMMIGLRMDETALKRCFLIAAALTALVLLLELISTSAYADFLRPGAYFENTRGLDQASYDERGLFPNAIGFEGRFSILNIADHRTASLFLEQVSLANFTTLLVIFLVSMWKKIAIPARIFYIALIALILVSNNSRTALALALAGPLVYYFAPRIPRYLTLLVMPLVLLAGLVVTLSAPRSSDDTLVGRVGLTIRNLGALDLPGILGTRADLAKNFLDSGYVYVIYSMSFLGVLFLWVLMARVLPGDNKSQRRCAWLLTMYISFNLLIGSSAIFSIKVAGLLWLLVGYLGREGRSAEPDGAPPLLQPDRTQTVASRHNWRPAPAAPGRSPSSRHG